MSKVRRLDTARARAGLARLAVERPDLADSPQVRGALEWLDTTDEDAWRTEICWPMIARNAISNPSTAPGDRNPGRASINGISRDILVSPRT